MRNECVNTLKVVERAALASLQASDRRVETR